MSISENSLPEPLSFVTLRAVDIREISEADWTQVWPIVRDVVEAAETFVYDPSMSSSQAWEIWVEAPPGLTVVAIEEHRVVGEDGTESPWTGITCVDGKLHGCC